MRNEGLPYMVTMVTTYGNRVDLGQGPTVAASAVCGEERQGGRAKSACCK